MPEEYRILRYEPDHRQAVLELHHQLLPRARSLNERYFAWKYEQNPYIPDPLFALVYAGSDLVAMRGLCGTQWVHPHGAAETIPAAEDLIIHPAHRNRGLFLLIDRALAAMAAEHGYTRLASLSANAATRGLQRITGWTRIAALDGAIRDALRPPAGLASKPLVRRIRSRSAALARRADLEMPRAAGAIVIDRILDGVDRALPNIRTGTSPNIDAFVSLSYAPNALRQAHTAAFYRWRLRNPDRVYRYVYWDDGAVRGYLILGLQPSNPRRILVVDAGAERDAFLLDLVNALAGATRPSLTALPGALPRPVGDRLPRLGFVVPAPPGAEPFVAVFMRPAAKTAAPAAASHLHTALLDTMLG